MKLLVEGGGELAWSLMNEGQVDRLVWIIAPKIFGGRDAKTSVEGSGVDNPSHAFSFSKKKFFQKGEDLIFEGLPSKKS